MLNQFGDTWPDCATGPDRGAVGTGKRLYGTLGRFMTTQEGVGNVSIEDVDGDGPFAGVRPNAGGGGADDGESFR
jgi:hypothetical protein